MSDAPTSGEIVGGKYRILRALGQGGMGIVFEAQNVVTGKRVALKWLRPQLGNDRDASERFMREARVASRVHHQNVVDLYDVGRHDDALFLVMEYLDGESLAAFLARGLRPIPETVSLLLGAMRGLAAAHKQGIVHRDLKPENIFLARESDDAVITPKVLDFGISKLIAPETGQ
ncbi:MAG: serine/threonine protein kinase, partial [Myxococcaceae bacterium]|nr:serine/threonine protein kinase [Myxococcaceae bacterium]